MAAIATVSSLPCEVVARIFANLDHVRDIGPVRLVSHHFNTSFLEHQTGTIRVILQNQIPGKLLPYAVAVALEKPEINREALTSLLCALHERPGEVRDQLSQLSIDKLKRMSHTHDAINEFTTRFSQSAWNKVLDLECEEETNPRDLELSSTEYVRIARAFYRVEWYLSVIRQINTRPEAAAALPNGADWFYSQHNPWECRQVLSTFEFLSNLVGNVDQTLASSYISRESARMFHRVTLAKGMHHIRKTTDAFASAFSDESEVQTLLGAVMRDDGTDLSITRYGYSLLDYSDPDDSPNSIVSALDPTVGERDIEIKQTWMRVHAEERGIPSWVVWMQMGSMGCLFWDGPPRQPDLLSVIFRNFFEDEMDSD